MAKKKSQQRRVPRASEPRMFGDGKPSVTTQPAERREEPQARPATQARRPVAAPAATQARRPAAPATAARPAAQPVDYSYVAKDLRRLGIVAAAIFSVLVILGFIIR